jgi:hypothetical protein
LDVHLARHPVLVALVLWVALVVVYHLDDSLVEEGDAVANIELPIALLQTGSLAFSPRYSPIVFNWKSAAPLEERDDYYVRNWFEHREGKATGVWYATGHLRLNGPRYFAVKSPERDAYVSTFSVLTGLSFLPMAAVLAAIDRDFPFKAALRLSAARLHAASLVALSAVLVLLIARRYVRPSHALLLALAYGLGTCMWAVASRTLWQQTVNIALLTCASYAFLRLLDAPKPDGWALITGLLLGTATASRPTAAFFTVAVGVYLLLHRREVLPRVIAGALPVLIATAVYNLHYFGGPFNFAQELVGHQVALEKTGSQNVWQTSLLVGAIGLLVSPSRGLLIFSPFLGLSFWGIARLWRDPKYGPLRPLVVAALLTMALQCKWFDWWGGWTYGYRPWLEVVPVLVLCLMPMIEPVCSKKWSASLFAIALGWSIFVQGLGAFAYDKYWNARDLFTVAALDGSRRFLAKERDARAAAQRSGASYQGLFACNIDLPPCRYRLWSIEDNVISFYLARYPVARERRTRIAWRKLTPFH